MDWQAITIYSNRAIEQPTTKVPSELFDSGRIQAIYLNELGAIETFPLGIGLLVLTILEGDAAIVQVKNMMSRACQVEAGNIIMDMLSTIIFYKFKTLSRDEVNAMLGYTIDELKESRAYQEIYADGREDGRKGERFSFILMQLNTKFGSLSQQQQASIQALNFDRLQALAIALLDFTQIDDLNQWLERQG